MSIIVIWENNLLAGGRQKNTNGHGWVGHAAMLIGDDWGALPANGENYVSWWPDGGAKPGESVAAEPNKHLVNDIRSEGYLPDHFIQLPDTQAGVLEMKATWNAIRSKQHAHYKMVSKNCSMIVARVMR